MFRRRINEMNHMEDLFSTSLAIDNRSVPYRVHFDKEQYIFTAAEDGSPLPGFALRRSHDNWEEVGTLAPGIKQQATEALERYLLQQH